jgi:hypothetical protein
MIKKKALSALLLSSFGLIPHYSSAELLDGLVAILGDMNRLVKGDFLAKLMGKPGTGSILLQNTGDKAIVLTFDTPDANALVKGIELQGWISLKNGTPARFILPAHSTAVYSFYYGGNDGADGSESGTININSGSVSLMSILLGASKWNSGYQPPNSTLSSSFVASLACSDIQPFYSFASKSLGDGKNNCVQITPQDSEGFEYYDWQYEDNMYPSSSNIGTWLTEEHISPAIRYMSEYNLGKTSTSNYNYFSAFVPYLNYPTLIRDGYFSPASVANVWIDDHKNQNRPICSPNFSNIKDSGSVTQEISINYVAEENKLWSDPTPDDPLDVTEYVMHIYFNEAKKAQLYKDAKYSDNPFSIDIGKFMSNGEFKPYRYNGSNWIPEPESGWTNEQPFSAEGQVYAVSPSFNHSTDMAWKFSSAHLFEMNVKSNLTFVYVSSIGNATLFYANGIKGMISSSPNPTSTSDFITHDVSLPTMNGNFSASVPFLYIYSDSSVYDDVFKGQVGNGVDLTYTVTSALNTCSINGELVAKKIPNLLSTLQGLQTTWPNDLDLPNPSELPYGPYFFQKPIIIDPLQCYEANSTEKGRSVWSALTGSDWQQRDDAASISSLVLANMPINKCNAYILKNISNGLYINSQGNCFDSSTEEITTGCYKFATASDVLPWAPPVGSKAQCYYASVNSTDWIPIITDLPLPESISPSFESSSSSCYKNMQSTTKQVKYIENNTCYVLQSSEGSWLKTSSIESYCTKWATRFDDVPMNLPEISANKYGFPAPTPKPTPTPVTKSECAALIVLHGIDDDNVPKECQQYLKQ